MNWNAMFILLKMVPLRMVVSLLTAVLEAISHKTKNKVDDTIVETIEIFLKKIGYIK